MIQGFHPFLALKRLLPRSLFGRFLIILVTPLLLVQLVLGYIFFDRHTDTIIRLLSDTIAGDVALVKDMVESGGKSAANIKQLASAHLKLDVVIRSGEKLQEVGQAKDAWLYDHMAKALQEQLRSPFFLKMDHDHIYIDVESSKGVIELRTLRKRLFSKTTPLVLIWTTASAFLLFAVAVLFMRNQIKPITRLADAAEKFGKGQQIIAFKPEGATEVRKAAQAFNQMRSRILRFIEERTLQLAGVSHDLRTPLTRMQLQLALMAQTDEVKSLQEDIEHMGHMVQGFLDFARGGIDEVSSQVDIKRFIKGIIEDFTQAHAIPIDFDAEESIKIHVKKNLFNRMLTNLLLNSRKYGEKVKVSLLVKLHALEIIVEDDGPGIPEGKYEEVFQPFHRLDPSRSTEMGGAGLGLTIVRDVISMHGGKVVLGKSSLGGLKVTLLMPR